jgi:uracil-DNA glycosylase
VARTHNQKQSSHELRTSPDHDCPLCPRLVSFRQQARKDEPTWHNAPVPHFGSLSSELLIVGLAPGLRGANRTGRPFTGDWAGDLLYETLLEYGFASGTYDERPDDGLTLINCCITNAVRCVPPENKPTTSEMNTCRPFLSSHIADMPNLKAIIALGRIAHDNVVRCLGGSPSKYPFAHGAQHDVQRADHQHLVLFDSYHCSRYNTNTGVLTPKMFKNLFAHVKKYLAT